LKVTTEDGRYALVASVKPQKLSQRRREACEFSIDRLHELNVGRVVSAVGAGECFWSGYTQLNHQVFVIGVWVCSSYPSRRLQGGGVVRGIAREAPFGEDYRNLPPSHLPGFVNWCKLGPRHAKRLVRWRHWHDVSA